VPWSAVLEVAVEKLPGAPQATPFGANEPGAQKVCVGRLRSMSAGCTGTGCLAPAAVCPMKPVFWNAPEHVKVVQLARMLLARAPAAAAVAGVTLWRVWSCAAVSAIGLSVAALNGIVVSQPKLALVP